MRSTLPWQNLFFGALLMLSLSACVARARQGTVYVEAAAPVHVETYPYVYYEGHPVYRVDGRWYYRRGPHWAYYREAPRALERHRVYVRQAPRAYAPRHRHERERIEVAPRARRERWSLERP
jgi:hypothetical protein